MPTIAQTIKNDIETKCPGCFSLYAGYAYVDGSRLAYRYNTQRQTYTLTAN